MEKYFYFEDCSIPHYLILRPDFNLLPLKYTEEFKNNLKYEDLSKFNFLNFRKVLLQGELLKFFIVLKIDGEKTQAAKDILDSIFFKIEFEATDVPKENESGNKNENE